MAPNRLVETFTRLRAQKRKAIMPFLCAGDPGLDTTTALLPALAAAGAPVIEVGFPFSDPIADGPVIQAAMHRALERGVQVQQVFDAVAAARPKTDAALVAMVSFSIVHKMGLQEFLKRSVAAGFDGMIFPDLAYEESGPAAEACADANLTLSLLVAPTTPEARAAKIAAACTGFVYVLARAGLTGARAELPPELPGRLERLRRITHLPLAVGFGVSAPDQARAVTSVADAAIVGSAFVSRVHKAAQEGRDPVEAGASFTRELVAGLA